MNKDFWISLVALALTFAGLVCVMVALYQGRLGNYAQAAYYMASAVFINSCASQNSR
jgi:hypothetical protein